MKEAFLQFIWQHKLYDRDKLFTSSGEKIEVLSNGELNTDAGPDFFNARVRIGDTVWAGNVEIHINSSDWIKHGHQNDKAYDNVILQIVQDDDLPIERTNGQTVPTATILFDQEIYLRYQSMLQNSNTILCHKRIGEVDEFTKTHWISSLLVERLEIKANGIEQKLDGNMSNWEETFYQQLTRNFGFKINADPFELLAKSLPIKYLGKHKDNLLQIEALLFGQAGMLSENYSDEYYLMLGKEYEFLKNKFKLKPIEGHLWKFLRLRPSNFPSIRIAQFAALIHKSTALFSKIIETNSITKLRELFKVECSAYWQNHYVFAKPSQKRMKHIGESTLDVIIINTVVPFLFVYGKAKDSEVHKTRALEYLEQLKPEKNTIIEKWEKSGLKSESAYTSQALIQLYNVYCKNEKCLNCQIGNRLIRKSEVGH